MIATIKKVWDNEDGIGQSYKVVLFEAKESGNKLKASTWDDKMFKKLVEGNAVEVSITKTEKGQKTYYNIAKITEIEGFEKASQAQSKTRDEGSYGQSIGNARTNAVEAVRIMASLELIPIKGLTKDKLLSEIDFATQHFFRDALHLKAQAIAGVFKDDENIPGPTGEGEETEVTEIPEEVEETEEKEDFEKENPDLEKVEKDIPF